MAGWGGISDIIERALEDKRKEDEARKAEETRKALEAQRAQERDSWNNPPPAASAWQPPAWQAPKVDLGPVVPASQGVSASPLDYGAPDLYASDVYGDTRSSERTAPSVAPVQTYGPRTQGEMRALGESTSLFDPWKAPTFGGDPNALTPPDGRNDYQTMQDFNRNVVSNLPQAQLPSWLYPQDVPPVTNDQQARDLYGGTESWWRDQPGYAYAAEKMQDVKNFDTSTLKTPDQVMEDWWKGAASNPILGAVTAPVTLPAAGLHAGWNALQQTDWGRGLTELGQYGLTGLNEAGMMLANAPAFGGMSASEILTPATNALRTYTLAPLGEQLGTTDQLPGYDVLQKTRDLTDEQKAQYGAAAAAMSPFNAALNMLFPDLFAFGAQYLNQQLGQTQALRQQAGQAKQQGNTAAWMQLRNLPSGAEAVAQGLDDVLNRDQKVQALEQQAMTLRDSDPTQAALLIKQANDLRNKSASDIVDQYMNPIAELIYGTIFDVTNFIPGLGFIELGEAGKAKRALTVGDELAQEYFRLAGEGGKALKTAMKGTPKEAQAVYREIIAPFQNAGEKLTNWSWLFARTTEGKAALDAEILKQGLGNILKGVQGKADLRAVLGALSTAPDQLVKGIRLSPLASEMLASADGLTRWGIGIVANRDFARRLPVLHALQEQLAGLKSLEGTGLVNRAQFDAELGNLIEQTAMILNNATPATGAKKVIQDVLLFPFRVQKAIMSDLWLGLRPANWAGNALGATMMLYANDLYTMTPVTTMTKYFDAVGGSGIVNPRMAEILQAKAAAVGTKDVYTILQEGQKAGRGAAQALEKGAKAITGSGAIDTLAQWVTGNPDNPLSRFMRAAYSVPYGTREIPLGGGLSVPVSEGSFYARAYYTAFKRTYENTLAEMVGGQLMPTLMQIPGVTEETAKTLGNFVLSVAQSGTRADVVKAIREYVGKPKMGFVLKELGVPPELLSPQAARQIEQFLFDAGPHQAQQVLGEIGRILDGERKPAASLLNLAPLQNGTLAWTDQDVAKEVAWMTDTLQRDLIKSGVDPAQAQAQAQQLAQRYVQGHTETFNRVLGDLAHAPNQPETWAMSMDWWTEVMQAKKQARQTVDTISREAVKLNNPEAWGKKWEVTAQTYDNLVKWLAQKGDEYRTDLNAILGGQPYKGKFDWWNTISGYLQYDEQAFREARNVELGAQSADPAAMAQFQKVIDANRALVDDKLYEVFGAFQKYPNTESFDLVRNAILRLDYMGAQAAQVVGEARDAALAGKMSWNQFYKVRNGAWNNFFDAGARQLDFTSRTVVVHGLAQDVPTNLRWTEPGGATWELMGQSDKQGKYLARNVATGATEEFSAATSAAEQSPFTIPQNVLEDWRSLGGNAPKFDEQQVQQVLDDIAATKPDVVRDNGEQLVSDIKQGRAEAEALLARMQGQPVATPAEVTSLPEGVPAPERTQSPYTSDPMAPDQLWPETGTPAVQPGRTQEREVRGAGERILGPYREEDIWGPATVNRMTGETSYRPPAEPPAPVVEPVPPAPSAPTNGAAVESVIPSATVEDISDADLRRLASEANIATATEKGRGFDNYLINAINKDTGTQVRSLAELTPEQRSAAADALRARAQSRLSPAEKAARVEPATAASAPPNNTGKPRLVGYEWRSERGEKFSAYDGGFVGARVSDWSRSEVSAGSGREIVHVYMIQDVDGTVKPYGKQTALKKLGYTQPARLDKEAARYMQEVEHARLVAKSNDEAITQIAAGSRNEALVNFRKRNPGAAVSVDDLLVGQKGDSYIVTTKDHADRIAAAERAGYEIKPWRDTIKPSGETSPNAPQFGTRPAAAPTTENMFAATSEDLPLMSGAAPRAEGTGAFAPKEVQRQESMFDVRPQMGSAEPSYAPTIAEGEGAREARAQIAAEWDRVASAGSGLGSIDSYVMKYNRGGTVNLNLNKGEVKAFEDLYGVTIAGQPVNDLNDVQRLLQQYVDLGAKAKNGKAAEQVARAAEPVSMAKLSRLSKENIIKQAGDELRAVGYTDADFAAMDRKSLLAFIEDNRRGGNMKSYDYMVPDVAQFMGMESPDSPSAFYEWLRGVSRSRQSGANMAPQVAEVAQEQIRSINDLERTLRAKMPELLAGKPNELTNYQKLRAIDAVVDWAPAVDEAQGIAARVGEKMGGWTMLNYGTDSRNIDGILSLFFPYHFFWSRMPGRVALSALSKPKIVNGYYELQRAIDLENEQSGVPQRLQGTVPIPGTDKRFGLSRVLDYVFPAQAYLQPNPYAETDSDNPTEQALTEAQKFTPSMYTLINLAIDLSDGKLDKNYTLNDLLPIPPSSVYQRVTGNMPQGGNFFSSPNEWDPYRAKRGVSYIAGEENIDDSLVDAANQVIDNQYAGNPIGQDVPPELLEQAIALAQQGVKRGAGERLLNRGSAFVGLGGVYSYPEVEQQQKERSDAYNVAGYDPNANPQGSKQWQKDIMAQYPSLATWWSKGSETPGVDSQMGLLYDQKKELEAQRAEAERQAVIALPPDATKDDIYNAKQAASAPYNEKLDAVNAELDQLRTRQEEASPNAGEPKDPRKGMSPQEVSGAYATSVMYEANKLDGEPVWPGDDASKAEKSAYYKANDAYKKAQEQYVIDALSKPQVSTSDILRERRGPVSYTEDQARKLWQDFTNRYRSPEEIARNETIDAANAAKAAENDKWSPYWDEYRAFDEKDWTAKRQYMLDHPEFAAYYKQKYGDDSAWWENDGKGSKYGNKYGGKGNASAQAFSDNWDEYNAFGDDWASKAQYMLEHPEFAKYYMGRYGDDSAWWLKYGTKNNAAYGRVYYGGYYGGGGGGRGGGGGGGGYYGGGGSNNVYVRPEGINPALLNWRWKQPWRPERFDYSWLNAGRDLAPEPIRAWQPPRW